MKTLNIERPRSEEPAEERWGRIAVYLMLTALAGFALAMASLGIIAAIRAIQMIGTL